jgi:anti-sigma factor RsiW
LVLGLGLAYQFSSGLGGDPIVTEALAARQNTMRPDQTFASTNLPAQQTRDQVLTRALAMMVKVPDLTKMGYQLADIHIYSGVPGGKAVELAYIDPQKRLFTLYLRHPSGPARVDLLQRDRMRICIWQDDVVGTVMLGEMSAGEMARIASLAYSGLTL